MWAKKWVKIGKLLASRFAVVFYLRERRQIVSSAFCLLFFETLEGGYNVSR